MSYGYLAFVVNFTKNAAYQCCLAFAVPAYKCNLFASVYGEVDILKDGVRAKGFFYFGTYNGIVAASCCRCKFQAQTACVLFVNFYGHHLFELLYPALYLYCFCRLVTEPFNELFYVGNLFLLVLVCPYLLFATLFARFHKLVIR